MKITKQQRVCDYDSESGNEQSRCDSSGNGVSSSDKVRLSSSERFCLFARFGRQLIVMLGARHRDSSPS